jgi:hypothetical protein
LNKSLNNSSLNHQSSSTNLKNLASHLIQNINDNLINFSFHSNSYHLKNYNNKTTNDEMLVTYKRFDSLNSSYSLFEYDTSLSETVAAEEDETEPILKLYFKVKYYVSDPLLLTNQFTRYLYYLQLKHNYLNINHKISEEKYFELASLALVSDFGVYDSKVHTGKYFDLNLYFPKWLINKLSSDYIYKSMPLLHSQLNYLTATSAQNKFIHELSLDDCPYNFHLYNLYKNKEETPGTIGLGIGPRSILIFDLRNTNEIRLISTFNWSSVVKINFNVIIKHLYVQTREKKY